MVDALPNYIQIFLKYLTNAEYMVRSWPVTSIHWWLQ